MAESTGISMAGSVSVAGYYYNGSQRSPTPGYSCPLCNPLPLRVPGPSDLLPMNKYGKCEFWHYEKHCQFYLACKLSLFLWLSYLHTLMKQTAVLGRAHGKELRVVSY